MEKPEINLENIHRLIDSLQFQANGGQVQHMLSTTQQLLSELQRIHIKHQPPTSKHTSVSIVMPFVGNPMTNPEKRMPTALSKSNDKATQTESSERSESKGSFLQPPTILTEQKPAAATDSHSFGKIEPAAPSVPVPPKEVSASIETNVDTDAPSGQTPAAQVPTYQTPAGQAPEESPTMHAEPVQKELFTLQQDEEEISFTPLKATEYPTSIPDDSPQIQQESEQQKEDAQDIPPATSQELNQQSPQNNAGSQETPAQKEQSVIQNNRQPSVNQSTEHSTTAQAGTSAPSRLSQSDQEAHARVISESKTHNIGADSQNDDPVSSEDQIWQGNADEKRNKDELKQDQNPQAHNHYKAQADSPNQSESQTENHSEASDLNSSSENLEVPETDKRKHLAFIHENFSTWADYGMPGGREPLAPTLVQNQSLTKENDNSYNSSYQQQHYKDLNEQLSQPQEEWAHKMQSTPIDNLASAIGINDRYLFISELFRGDESMYERSIITLNKFNSYQEAHGWSERELRIKLGWDTQNPITKQFEQLIHRRFMPRS